MCTWNIQNNLQTIRINGGIYQGRHIVNIQKSHILKVSSKSSLPLAMYWVLRSGDIFKEDGQKKKKNG